MDVGTSQHQDALAGLERAIAARRATVAVVGLGYVGLPLALAVASAGFPVIGIDADREKVRALNDGRSYIDDVSDADLCGSDVMAFTHDPGMLAQADVVILAVPTPLAEGLPDLRMVRGACEQVAATLRPGQLIVLESTTYPGTTEEVVRPILETSGLTAGVDFALAYSPERIDPGSDWSLRATPKIVSGIGAEDTRLAASFYSSIALEVVITPTPREAEMAKLIENTFRQVNIALVNELAMLAPELNVDIWAALDAAATKPFGFAPFYPGPGVGGHCIAIDPSYLSWRVDQRLGFGIRFIEHARSVNNRMPAYVAGRIAETLNDSTKSLKGSRILALGVAYKAGVNDVRESPAIAVIERLGRAGAECCYHDPHVSRVRLLGREMESQPLEPELIERQDCIAILTAHPEVDYSLVLRHASVVFDARGVTRGTPASNVVRL